MKYKDTRLGKCHPDFDAVPLKQMIEKNDAGTWGSDPIDVGNAVVRSTNFNDTGYLDLSDVALRLLDKETFEEKKILLNEILIERSGGSETQPVGRVSFITQEVADKEMAFANFIQRISAKEDVHPKFLFYCLYQMHSAGFTQIMQNQTNGIRNLEYRFFTKQILPKPKYKEQERIASILSAVDANIKATKQSIAKLERLKKSLMQNLLTGKIKPDGTERREKDFITHEKFGKIPLGWKFLRLKDVIREAPAYGANASAVPFSEELPKYIRITDIDDFGNIIEENKASISNEDAAGYFLEDNDFLFARTGDTVGKSFLYKKEFGNCAYAGYMIRFQFDYKKIIPEYFKTIAHSFFFEAFKESMKRIGAKPNINATEYGRFAFLLPDEIEEQENVLKPFMNILKLIGDKHEKNKKLERLKKSLMQNLLTGKIRVCMNEKILTQTE